MNKEERIRLQQSLSKGISADKILNDFPTTQELVVNNAIFQDTEYATRDEFRMLEHGYYSLMIGMLLPIALIWGAQSVWNLDDRSAFVRSHQSRILSTLGWVLLWFAGSIMAMLWLGIFKWMPMFAIILQFWCMWRGFSGWRFLHLQKFVA